MSRAKAESRLTITQNFICGGLAGMFSRTVLSPLEVVRISCQIGTPETRQGAYRAFRTLYQQQGWKAFWKGNAVACFRLPLYSVIHLFTYENLSLKLVDEQGRLSASTATIACMGAAISSTAVLYPTDLVMARLIAQNADKKQARYSGMTHAIKMIWKEEGFLRLYRGLSLAVLELIPFTGVVYFTHSAIDQLIDKPKSEISTEEHFARWCMSTAFAKMIVYPLHTIKRKMQASSAVLPDRGGVDVDFRGMWDAFRQTGFTGLWRGATVGLLKVVPYSVIMMLAFEYMKRPFLFYNRYTTSPWFEEFCPGVDQSLRPHELEEWYRQRANLERRPPVLIDD
ncbi:solute carrier family 25 member 43 [Lingula anatina]|uniref:Solute carrier family 25 member 43 n=1 Tax=Lingula anatina TaxID=7574 RepID=A0A1S3HS47_LINAN|nr:solute carrier family 25 member 43 [Lingula anatina]|eukprot:XP_013387879.1 solute carrier family 25 member 43 [Lingula anatina]